MEWYESDWILELEFLVFDDNLFLIIHFYSSCLLYLVFFKKFHSCHQCHYHFHPCYHYKSLPFDWLWYTCSILYLIFILFLNPCTVGCISISPMLTLIIVTGWTLNVIIDFAIDDPMFVCCRRNHSTVDDSVVVHSIFWGYIFYCLFPGTIKRSWLMLLFIPNYINLLNYSLSKVRNLCYCVHCILISSRQFGVMD